MPYKISVSKQSKEVIKVKQHWAALVLVWVTVRPRPVWDTHASNSFQTLKSVPTYDDFVPHD